MKEYRIGEFAKYLGVTPDLLKHYEDQGIILPSRSESGYRFYPFNTTMRLIECVRLRNFGLTLREIREILASHLIENDKVDRRLSENIVHLREEVLLNEALAEDYENFLDWRKPLAHADSDWEIRWSEPMCFLPHTDKYDFLKDPRIYEILKSWMSYIPIVKSSMKNEADGRITWGFLVEERMLGRLSIPVNGVVERIPSGKVFYYKFRGPLIKTPDETANTASHPAFSILNSLGLKHSGSYFRTTLMPADWQQDLSYQYGYYAIPLDPSSP